METVWGSDPFARHPPDRLVLSTVDDQASLRGPAARSENVWQLPEECQSRPVPAATGCPFLSASSSS
jgi:hypothetical protein